ncbi:cell division protein FtsL [Herbinix luporum]|uniref:cell division protein FtsL n=1 Tax=Herbinix luporum TaxID=1679721 RepID=UPI0017754C5D|nr:septum formation initiator family protein [Herbinix luporum]HHT58029.1 hypothetical protein [Herbinix luporum]
MARNNKSYRYQTRTNYTDGNTARKREFNVDYAMGNYNAVPDRQTRPIPEPQRRVETRPQKQVRRQPRELSGISKTSLFILILAIGATLYFCIEFLMLQNQVSKMERDIISMERNLTAMKNENDAAYEQIEKVYDLDYVYNIAVNELGMVYPNNNEIITFKKADENYVRQYADIPD